MNPNKNYSSGNLAGLSSNRPALHQASFTSAARQRAIRKAHLHPSMQVGLLGARSVVMGKQLTGLVRTVHLVEPSPTKADAARRKLAGHANLLVHQLESGTLPFADSSLDALFANLYLQDCSDPSAALSEMTRVLKPGGRLTLTEIEKDPSAETGLGFDRPQLRAWLIQADLVNLVIEGEECCPQTTSDAACCVTPQVNTQVLVASGSLRVRARDQVQAGYAARAEAGGGCCSATPDGVSATCCTPQEVIPADALLDTVPILPLYSAAEVSGVPAEAAGLALGCGNPTALAKLQPGETVLDIGSGGGIDVFLAARKVGPEGHVIGVDMTPAMLERARRTAVKAGLTNVEFRQGFAEALPVEDGSVDVIISNCVINLTEDKGLAWREAYRALKPGGRVEVSDVATDISLPPHLRLDARGWAECITGALPLAETVDLLKQAGFKQISTQPSAQHGTIEGVQVFSTLFSALK